MKVILTVKIKYCNTEQNKNLFYHLFYFLDEDLIKWGWPEDVWFHVDKVSSAHVYLRLAPVRFN